MSATFESVVCTVCEGTKIAKFDMGDWTHEVPCNACDLNGMQTVATNVDAPLILGSQVSMMSAHFQ